MRVCHENAGFVTEPCRERMCDASRPWPPSSSPSAPPSRSGSPTSSAGSRRSGCGCSSSWSCRSRPGSPRSRFSCAIRGDGPPDSAFVPYALAAAVLGVVGPHGALPGARHRDDERRRADRGYSVGRGGDLRRRDRRAAGGAAEPRAPASRSAASFSSRSPRARGTRVSASQRAPGSGSARPPASDSSSSCSTAPRRTTRTGRRSCCAIGSVALHAPRPRRRARPRSRSRSVRRRFVLLMAVGLLDLAGNAFFAVASTKGLIGVVAVVSSLYPVGTVALARIVLGERLTAVRDRRRVRLAGRRADRGRPSRAARRARGGCAARRTRRRRSPARCRARARRRERDDDRGARSATARTCEDGFVRRPPRCAPSPSRPTTIFGSERSKSRPTAGSACS